MSDGSLSQDEIDALLQGSDDVSMDMGGLDSDASNGGSGGVISQGETNALVDLFSSAAPNMGSALVTMVGKQITIGNPRVEVINLAGLQNQLSDNIVEVIMNYEGGLSGEHSFYLDESLAKTIGGLMMGQEAAELNDALLSAVSEAMSVISGNAATTIGTKIEQDLRPQPPEIAQKSSGEINLNPGTDYVKVQYDFTIEGEPPSQLIEVFSVNVVKEFASKIMPAGNDNSGMMNNAAQQMGGGMNPNMGGMNQGMGMNPNMGGMQPGMGMNPNMGGMQQGMGMNPNMGGMQPGMGMNPNMGGMQPGMGMPYQQTQIQGVQYSNLNAAQGDGQNGNINLLMDVNMEMTVELGRTRKSIKEILSMGEGTVIELDKLAGEPVDVLVNGKLIAKGEVVVIDENFGVRVTEIINPLDRIRDLS